MSETERFKEAAEQKYPPRADHMTEVLNCEFRSAFLAGASHGYAQGREDEAKAVHEDYEKVRAAAFETEALRQAAEARVKELEGALELVIREMDRVLAAPVITKYVDIGDRGGRELTDPIAKSILIIGGARQHALQALGRRQG